jgi:hypothetical protein
MNPVNDQYLKMKVKFHHFQLINQNDLNQQQQIPINNHQISLIVRKNFPRKLSLIEILLLYFFKYKKKESRKYKRFFFRLNYFVCCITFEVGHGMVGIVSRKL